MARNTTAQSERMERKALREKQRQIQHKRKIRKLELKKAKQKNKIAGRFMKIVVACEILAALIFTIVMIIVFLRVGSEPSTLIENVFRYLSIEGGAMALIKSVKTVTKSKSESSTVQQEQPENPDDNACG